MINRISTEGAKVVKLPKPCKYCKGLGHLAFGCTKKPRKPLKTTKRINRIGRISKDWRSARELWFKKHTSDTFKCFYCKKPLERSEVTLDHYLSRGRHPELRNELSNLVVACWECNTRKGSLSGDQYLEQLKEGKHVRNHRRVG